MKKVFKNPRNCKCCNKSFIPKRDVKQIFCSQNCKKIGELLTYEEVCSKLPDFVKIKWDTYSGANSKSTFIDTEYNEEFSGRLSDVVKHNLGCKLRRDMEKKRGALNKIKSRLPPFVKIYEETYTKYRERAKFLDIDYNEDFWSCVCGVVNGQYGCKSRNRDRIKKFQQKQREKNIIRIKNKLPSYLYFYEDSFKNLKCKAKFKDLEYGIEFERHCCAILYGNERELCCKERWYAKICKKLCLTMEEVKNKIFNRYGDSVRIIESTYRGTNKSANFEIVGKGVLRTVVSHAFAGELTKEKMLHKAWGNSIKQSYLYSCAISNSKTNLHAHHIFSKFTQNNLRYELYNGICLSRDIHYEFHRIYGRTGNTKEQLLEFAKSKGVDLTQRLIQCPNSYYEI